MYECIKSVERRIWGFDEIYPLEQNVGLGNALKEGMQHCRYELVARMDSDDISVEDRFEKQLALFEKYPDLSAAGSDIAEFIGNKENIVSIRAVPEKHEDICKYLKKRCPLNHVSVMLKKSDVEKREAIFIGSIMKIVIF